MTSPCKNCSRDERCMNICNDFAQWFIAEWDKTTEVLRKVLRIEKPTKEVGGSE